MNERSIKKDINSRKRHIALARRAGASPEALEAMRAADQAAADWEAHCPRCSEHIFGKLDDLRMHQCGGKGK
jgi:hypothetical protein